MRTDYTKPLYTQVKKPASKLRVNKKRLFIVFFCAFVIFFSVCTFLAALLTPNIDVPALNNEEAENAAPPLTSDDFKGRIDPRLKQIEEIEDKPAPIITAPSNKQNNNTAGNDELNQQDDSSSYSTDSNDTYQETDPVPYSNNRKNIDILMPEDLQYEQPMNSSEDPQHPKQVELQKPAGSPMPARKTQAAPKTYSPPGNLDLREKVNDNQPPTPIE